MVTVDPGEPRMTYRRRLLLEVQRLGSAMPFSPGLFLIVAAVAKVWRLWTGHVDVPVNELIFPVELTCACALLLGGDARRLAALFLAVLTPVAIVLVVFFDLIDAGEWWWFLPFPLPFAVHIAVLAAIGADSVAVLFHEQARGARPEALDVRRLTRLFE